MTGRLGADGGDARRPLDAAALPQAGDDSEAAPAGRHARSVFAVREFRSLWGAELVSAVGDQLARLALAVLVYAQTSSAGLSALVYALTFLPAMLGGILLAGLADRYRRRELMVLVDLLRAGLVVLMAVPWLPLGALCGVLVVVVLLSSVHSAAQAALLPLVLPGERYERGLAVRQITAQAVQLAAFAGGGALLVAVPPRTALLLNAVSFLISGVVLRLGVASRPAPVPPADDGTGPRSVVHDGITAIREILADPARRTLLGLVLLVSVYVVPEAIAAPYASALGNSPFGTGLLMAADPAGSVIGAFAFQRLVPARLRSRLIGVLAVLAGFPLIACVSQPGLWASVVLWVVSGALSTAFMVQAQALFVRATPDARRGSVVGVAASCLLAAQGVTVFLGGVLADHTGPAMTVAIAGAVGTVLAVGGAVAWRSARAGG
ncbi:MFS transporter [Pseudonocardia benzenivorans]|uniref:MFS transporter n=1 Tax=Pseudonocardia benzenivorans TaxID=228005 RepID=A0ABW3VQL3_9PSEU